MITVLSKAIDVDCGCKGSVVMIECNGNCSAGFLLMHFLATAQSKGMQAIVVTASKNEKAYRTVAARMLMRMTANVTFIPIFRFLSSELKNCNDSVLTILEKEIETTIRKNHTGVCLLIDNATLLSDICQCPTAVINFYRRLQNKLMQENSNFKLVAVFPSYCDTLTNFKRNSDFVLHVKHIGTGFAKDVTGELVVFDRFNKITPSKQVFHYCLSDKSTTIYPPGLSNPLL